MVFRGKNYKKITIKIQPLMDFKQILDTLEEIELTEVGAKAQNVKYALLEMVNNSLRAHRENGINDPLQVSFEFATPSLLIEVQDRGPGFDPEKLPYSLSESPHKIDLKSEAFVKYREENDYKRFGMGLYVVKKTFTEFRLSFIDDDGNQIPWTPGGVHGTHIKVTIEREENGT